MTRCTAKTSPSGTDGDCWIFAYGSLIWDPGFDHIDRETATLHGFHRAFCIYSWVYRGTEKHPGLVLGLDRGGACRGIAYRVAEAGKDEVVRCLDARELVTGVYRPVNVTLRLDNGDRVQARTYAAVRGHPQYAGKLDPAEQAAIIRQAQGRSGPNLDYAIATLAHLRAVNIHDRRLEAVAQKLEFEAAKRNPA